LTWDANSWAGASRYGIAFGIYVQEQLYQFLVWAIPLLVLVTAASVNFVALA
jgi:hypothetical protein